LNPKFIFLISYIDFSDSDILNHRIMAASFVYKGS
jgi:hypothetical protein